jgi:predicted peptidase
MTFLGGWPCNESRIGMKLWKSDSRLHRLGFLAAFLVGVGCGGEQDRAMGSYPYDKIQPESWRELKAIRDSHGPITNLDSIYEARTHANGLPYHLYVPKSLRPGVSYPLVVFLHGQGDLDLEVHNGYPKGFWSIPSVQSAHPHILFLPRHRTESDDWTRDDLRQMVIEALDDLISELNGTSSTPDVDTNRIYLTGFSLGGKGTWDYLKHYPHKFAAACPLSGYFAGPQNESEARALEDIPIWIFNGSDDDGVEGSRTSFQALKAVGAADVRYHEYVDHGHVIDDFAYFTDGFTDWLFSHQKDR